MNLEQEIEKRAKEIKEFFKGEETEEYKKKAQKKADKEKKKDDKAAKKDD